MQLLIVDDEEYAVKALSYNVDWHSIGFTKVHEAYSTEQAKHLIETNDIAAMICDIEMPGGSGLELLEWVKARAFRMETVFLTCHPEFDYAHKGIRLGIYEYLLKPVDVEHMHQIMHKLVVKIMEETESQRFKAHYDKYSRLWEEQKPLVIERFWQDVLERRLRPTDEHLDKLRAASNLGLSASDSVLPILIGVEEWRRELSAKDKEIMNYALRKAAEELILGTDHGSAFRDREGSNVLLLYRPDISDSELKRRCQAFIQASDRYFYCQLSCFVGEPVAIADLPSQYARLADMYKKNVKRSQTVMTLDEELSPGDLRSMPPLPFEIWCALFETGKTDELLRKVEAYMHAIESNQSLMHETLEALHLAIVNMIYRAFHKQGISVQELFEANEATNPTVLLRSFSQVRLWSRRTIAEGARIFHMRGGDGSAAVVKIKQYIDLHLDRDFSRDDIAASVYLNADYITRIFRKETGLSLQEYIIQRKLERSKELLTGTNLKISDLGQQIGYSNITYFTKLFKRVIGISPHEYRKKYKK
jgi:two-component system response regulator YesN